MKGGKVFILFLIFAAFVVAPVRLDLLDPLRPKFEPAFANADSGSSGDDDEDDEDDEEGGNSGSGGGNSGSGSGSSGSGSGSSGSGSGNSGSGSGVGNGNPNSGGQGITSGQIDGIFTPSSPIVRITVSSQSIEIKYSDGFEEEISNGIYEVEDQNGRTIIRRIAAGSDVVRLKAVASRASIRSVIKNAPTRDDVQNVDINGQEISVQYSNGWKEQVTEKSYQLIDPYNRTVVVRAPTRSDRNRLESLAGTN